MSPATSTYGVSDVAPASSKVHSAAMPKQRRTSQPSTPPPNGGEKMNALARLTAPASFPSPS